jgi:hypothetical protein
LLAIVKIGSAALGLLAGCGVVAQPEAERAHAVSAEAAAQGEIATADDLLVALESAGENIRHLSADIRYVKEFAIQGDVQTREGRLVFESQPGEVETAAPARRFGITFDKFQVGERVEDEQINYLEQFIFDGEWLAEIRPNEKQFIRRQVVRPGERWDPLKVGEGPFPIPIQQRREDIVRQYNAELLEGGEGLDEPKLAAVGGKSYQLKLTPRTDAGDSELREVRIWYDKETLLPRIARTVNTADDVSLVLLKNVKLNEEAAVSEAELSTEPPADQRGWNVTQEAYRGEE